MSETVKLKTVNTYKANQTNILPLIGAVQFDENAIIEIDSELVSELIQIMPEFSLVEESTEVEKSIIIVGQGGGEDEGADLEKQTEENDLGKGDDKDTISPQTQENDITGSTTESVIKSDETETVETVKKVEEIKKTKEEVVEILKDKTATELKEILASFPIEETSALKNKEQYINFLSEKLSQ